MSTLPDWMRDPAQDDRRRTWRWRAEQWLTRQPLWRAVADRYWAFTERRRMTRRFPVVTAILAFVLAWAVTLFLVMLLYWLYQRYGGVVVVD